MFWRCSGEEGRKWVQIRKERASVGGAKKVDIWAEKGWYLQLVSKISSPAIRQCCYQDTLIGSAVTSSWDLGLACI